MKRHIAAAALALFVSPVFGQQPNPSAGTTAQAAQPSTSADFDKQLEDMQQQMT